MANSFWGRAIYLFAKGGKRNGERNGLLANGVIRVTIYQKTRAYIRRSRPKYAQLRLRYSHRQFVNVHKGALAISA
jgi:hypothetical protein